MKVLGVILGVFGVNLQDRRQNVCRGPFRGINRLCEDGRSPGAAVDLESYERAGEACGSEANLILNSSLFSCYECILPSEQCK